MPDVHPETDLDVSRAAAGRAQQHAARAAEQAALAASAAAEALGGATSRAYQAVREHAETLPVPQVLEGVLEEGRSRGAEALRVLAGRQPAPPSRWPYVAGALVGAVVAGAAAVVARRLLTGDAPGAQEPDQLRAVVDLPQVPAAVVPDAPGGVVDEDGEAVLPTTAS